MRPIAGLRVNGKRHQLFVVLHAFCQNPKALEPIHHAITDVDPDTDIFAPTLPFAGPSGFLCMRDATEVVLDLMKAIDQIVTDRNGLGDGGYAAVNFVGHSIGAVMARKLAIIAHGEQTRSGEDSNLYAPFEEIFASYRAPRRWTPLIKRIVLIAGMNRGWSASSAMDWLTSIGWSLGTFVGETLLNGRPIIFDIRQGAVFSVQTRLQWLALMHRDPDKRGPNSGYPDRPNILVVQLLGTVDDIVAPDDSVDYAVDVADQAELRSYFYLQVPNSGHKNIVDLPEHGVADFASWRRPPADECARLSGARLKKLQQMDRYVEFRRALTATPQQLMDCAVTRDQLSDSLPNPPNWKVKDVVFVIHGIRDKGFWTQKIARAIKQEAEDRKQEFRSVTTSYGYFAMAPFVLPWIRKQKAEWLMDQYAEARAHYPRADFSYVGHSNGTYLVARALGAYPAARFKRIVLAGSVVRRDYKWLDLIKSDRIKEVLNYVATGDWVVAIFPKGMEPMPIFDLGAAGHDGFREASPTGPVHQVSYIAGSHGAGHEERHWRDIARFIVLGEVPNRDASRRSPLVCALGFVSTVILLALLGGALWGGLLIGGPVLCKLPGIGSLGVCESSVSADLSATAAALRTFATVAYFWVVYIVLSRV
jgi:pimeloyl-ACP methyl ester carboxylesterase